MSGLRERLTALAGEWEAALAAIPSTSSQIDAGIRASLRGCAAEVRALLDETADEPTALAGYMVAPGANGDLAIWRDYYPCPEVAARKADIDPALWDVLVAAVERANTNITETP